jgi:hypothetical protein
VITSYQFHSSDLEQGSVRLESCKLSRISFVCLIGMLENMQVMSREAKLVVGVMGVLRRSWISSVVFFMLKECGSGAIYSIFRLKESS